MLITILDIDEREKNEVALNFKYFWKGIIDRYMRFMPVYASILLVRAAPMFLHLGGHPIFDKFARLEGSNCRKNWWSNFLFINNIAHLDDAVGSNGTLIFCIMSKLTVSLNSVSLKAGTWRLIYSSSFLRVWFG